MHTKAANLFSQSARPVRDEKFEHGSTHAEYTFLLYLSRAIVENEEEGDFGLRTIDSVTTRDFLNGGRFAYDLYERLPLVSLLVQVSNVAGGKSLC